jgi:Tfp pilus assembly protein FimT
MLRFFKRNYLPKNSFSRGFSIVELMVTIVITTVIISTIVSGQSSYVDGAALSNVADEIGLTISQAQAYGIAVKELTPGSENFAISYGIALSKVGAGNNLTYLFFADRNSNHAYDGSWTCDVGGENECLEKKNISRGNYIDSVCVISLSDEEDCEDVGRVDVSFTRPETQAHITFFDLSETPFTPTSMKGAKIILKSPTGAARSVVVYESGNVSVQ